MTKSTATPLKEFLKNEVDERHIHRMWIGVDRARVRHQIRQKRRRYASALVPALLLLGLFLHIGPDDAPQHQQKTAKHATIPSVQLSAMPRNELILSEYARVSFDQESIVTSDHTKPHSVIVQHGTAHFDVKPDNKTPWSIVCGQTIVEVAGAQFSIVQSAEQTLLTVSTGAVTVHEKNRDTTVSAGQSFKIQSQTKLSSSTYAKNLTPSHGSPQSAAPIQAKNFEPVYMSSPPTDSIKTDDQVAETPQASIPALHEKPPVLPIEELLAQADRARLANNPTAAIQALQQVVTHYRSDPRASIAMFTLGKLQSESLHNASSAQDAFTHAIDLGLPANLAEDAAFRIFETRAKANDFTGAKKSAMQYQQKFPNGRYSAKIEQWLATH